MLVKRLGIGVVSLAVGFIITALILKTEFVGTTLEEYGIYYTFFTSLAFAFALGIWLDKFLDTKMLPE
jgi:hypothetical protein